MTTLTLTRPAAGIAWTDTYYNGGVEGRSLAEWYDTAFAKHFDAMDFTADLPDLAPVAAEDKPARQERVDLCASCQLCVDGSIFAVAPGERVGERRGPSKSYSCVLLRWTNSGEVSGDFAKQTIRAARDMQARAIEGFVTAMPEHFGTLAPRDRAGGGRALQTGARLGRHGAQPERDSAWFHFETYRRFIRLNFESGFLKD